jgi:hypothetical protein
MKAVQEENVMGEAKRRKEQLGEKYGQEGNIYPWLPIKKSQAQQFVQWSTRGAWIGIGVLVAYWVLVRLLGPALGWWELTD